MFRHCIRYSNKTRTCLKEICQYTTLTEKWDLQAAICLEKKPIVIPPLEKLETDFRKVLSEIEVENSLKSDFELQIEKDV